MTSDTTNAIRNRKNSTLAIPAAVPARPVKPKMAARMATMKNPIAQLSIKPPDSWIGNRPVQSPCLRKRGLALRLGDRLDGFQLLLDEHLQLIVGFLGRFFRMRQRRLAVRRHQSEDP